MNKAEIKKTLVDLKLVINEINNDDFVLKNSVLSNATVGEHTRHIIELFKCLLNFYDSGTINYDLRERNIIIQTDKNVAVNEIDFVINNIEKPNKLLILEQSFSDETVKIETNYYRELIYNLEHCIHHQAFIKIGIKDSSINNIADNFGVSPSTIKHKNSCAP